MSKNSSGKTENALLKGLTRTMPSGTDDSMKPPKGSVNDDATRSGTAKGPKAPGNRTA